MESREQLCEQALIRILDSLYSDGDQQLSSFIVTMPGRPVTHFVCATLIPGTGLLSNTPDKGRQTACWYVAGARHHHPNVPWPRVA